MQLTPFATTINQTLLSINKSYRYTNINFENEFPSLAIIYIQA